jgi:RimJ/RimL family protein N-acetyltransferase
MPTTPGDLVTERLVLRPMTVGDAQAIVAAPGAPATGRPAHWPADFPDEGDRGIAALLVRDPGLVGSNGHRLVIERSGGLVVGGIGLYWPPTDGRVELGYGIVPSRQGRGYATEAALAFVEFAFTLPGVRTVWADVERDNRASIRVLVKSWFRHGETNGTVARFHRDAPARPLAVRADAEASGGRR